MTLHEILVEIARIAGRSPPRIRLPNAALLPIAYAAEAVGRLTGRTTRVTVEPVRMARKRMFFSSEKAVRELGYRWRAPAKAFENNGRYSEGLSLCTAVSFRHLLDIPWPQAETNARW